MIGCFENLIGIKTQCGEPVASDSGYYLQDLPLINLKLADSMSDGQNSAYQSLKKRLDFSGNNLVNDVRNRLAPYFLKKSVMSATQAGYYQDNKRAVPGLAGNYKGIQIRISEYEYLDVFISEVSLFVNHTGQVPIQVIDLVQGRVIDTINVTSVAGQIVRVPIHKTYSSNGQYVNLFIGYDSTGIDSYFTNIYTQPGRYLSGCSACRPTWSYRNMFMAIYSRSLPVAGPLIMNNLTGINECGGVSLTISLSCSMDKWICQMKNVLAYPLLYLAGVEILKEAMASDRFNSLLTLNRDKMAAVIEDYELEYGKAMDGIFKNLSLPNDICFKCNSKINTGFATL